ncbi:GntR family transcriptional regulator [Rhizobium sp. RCAM05350]|nr:GntR family transcriptional regulator [Rhizobium sp. RCAM05350]
MSRGERLPEQALASRCNVSRTPIRKALQFLAEKSIVTAEVEGGYLLAIDPASFPGLEDTTQPAEETELYNAILRDVSAGRISDSQTVAGLQRHCRRVLQRGAKCTDKAGRGQSGGTCRRPAMVDQAVRHQR